MGLVWLISMVVFAAPHPLWGRIWDPIMHRPIFLLVGPLLLALISALFPTNLQLQDDPDAYRARIRSRLWGQTIVGSGMALFMIVVLIAVNGSPGTGKGGTLPIDLALLLLLALVLAAVWKGVRALRNHDETVGAGPYFRFACAVGFTDHSCRDKVRDAGDSSQKKLVVQSARLQAIQRTYPLDMVPM